jgi:hypothetical protein
MDHGAAPGDEEALRVQQFAAAMKNAELASVADQPGLGARARSWAGLCGASALARGGITFAAAVLILLVLRPPFALRFQHDARRPWKAYTAVSWTSVLLTAALAAAAAAWLPPLMAAVTTAPCSD